MLTRYLRAGEAQPLTSVTSVTSLTLVRSLISVRKKRLTQKLQLLSYCGMPPLGETAQGKKNNALSTPDGYRSCDGVLNVNRPS